MIQIYIRAHVMRKCAVCVCVYVRLYNTQACARVCTHVYAVHVHGVHTQVYNYVQVDFRARTCVFVYK